MINHNNISKIDINTDKIIGIHNGENTHHQDQSILSIILAIKNTIVNNTAPLEDNGSTQQDKFLSNLSFIIFEI